MNKRNMLQYTIDESFPSQLSLEESIEADEEDIKIFESIPSYGDDEVPTKEEILMVEKVLKYASRCNYIGFTDEDAKLVMQCSTNILKWGLGYTNFMR